MTQPGGSDTEVCFGCRRQIDAGEPRIHIGIDEWGQANGQPPIGLGEDDIRVPFCDDCTKPVEHGWIPVYEALDGPPAPPEPGPPTPPRPPLHRRYS